MRAKDHPDIKRVSQADSGNGAALKNAIDHLYGVAR